MRKCVAALAVAATAFLSQPTPAQSEVDPATATAVRELLTKLGSVEQYNRVIDLLIDQMANGIVGANPGRGQQDLAVVLREVLLPDFKAIGPAMIELSVSSYAKRFTAQEIRELIAFYDTPVGQKLLREMPGLTTELLQMSGAVGQEVARRAFEKHRETLRQRGVNVPM